MGKIIYNGIDCSGGGDEVTITPVLSSGTKIADYTIDGTNGSLYAPSGNVTDVQIDGTSILSGGVANIETMTGAGSSTAGAKGLVPAPASGDNTKYLRGDGTWQDAQGASAVSDLTDVELTSLADKEILEWDAVAEKWKNVANSGGSGGNALILDAQIYSTDEKQVGVWIDGKPIYQKVFTFNPTISINANWSKFDNGATYAPIKGTAIQSSSQACYEVYIDVDPDGAYVRNISNVTYTGIDAIIMLYTKTTDTARSGGYQAYGFSPIIYSLEEREVGVWTDNKPLYARTWKLTTEVLLNNQGITISAIDTSGMETLVEGCASYSIATNTKTIPLMIWKYNNTTYYASSLQAYVDIVTLYYTKTTDVAGSGSYNTLGVPTVHYTTDEQVIGTWTDGKPLYEKTITQQLSGTTGSINITSLNIDTGWIYDGFYDIGVTSLGLNESMGGNNVTYTHLNAGLNPPYIDCKNAISQNSTIHVTIRYTKTTD